MIQTLQELERSLAFEHCVSVINTYGVAVDDDDCCLEDECRDWHDMTSALAGDDAIAIRECLTYLEWRGLLLRAAHNSDIISIKDEHEA